MNNEEQLKLIIPLATYRKIMAYATLCDTEVSGFADVDYNVERNALIAGEVYLLEQTGAGTTVHMDEDALQKFNLEMIKKGVEQLPRLWWHSHVNMEAFFSGTDEETTEQLQNETFNVSLVVNKRKDMKAMAYYASTNGITGGKDHIKIDPLSWTIELDYERIPEALKKEVAKKVKTKVYELPVGKSKIYSWNKEEEEGGKRRGKFEKNSNNVTKPLTGVLYLPKDPQKALKRIEELGLTRFWIDGKWEYYDNKTGKTWVDYWETLEGKVAAQTEGDDFWSGQ